MPPLYKGMSTVEEMLRKAAEAGDLDRVRDLLEKGAPVASRGESGDTPLHIAAQLGHELICRLLLEAGAAVDTPTDNGDTPLHYAAWNGQEEACRLLLEVGAAVDTAKYNGDTPLHHAAANGQEEACRLLLEAGAAVDTPRDNGDTPLHHAAANGQEEACRLLLEAGAAVDTPTDNGSTPLHYAAANGQDEACQLLLLEAGAAVDTPTDNGDTPLHYAAWNGQEEACRLLLEVGAAVDTAKYNGDTPLHHAAANGQEEACRLLIEAGAAVDTPTDNGSTPLHHAAANGQEEACRLLIEAGAAVDTPRDNGDTPLHHAARNGRGAVSRILLEAGAAVDSQDGDGHTPLNGALISNNDAIVKLLLEAGASPSARESNGWSVLHFAALHGDLPACELLIESGAKHEIKSQNSFGLTPLDLARRNGHNGAVKLLLEAGASDTFAEDNRALSEESVRTTGGLNSSASGEGGEKVTVSLLGWGGSFFVAPVSPEAFKYWEASGPDELASYIEGGYEYEVDVPTEARFLEEGDTGPINVAGALSDGGAYLDQAFLEVTHQDGGCLYYGEAKDVLTDEAAEEGVAWNDIFIGYSSENMWRPARTTDRTEPGFYLLAHYVEKGLLLKREIEFPKGEEFDARRLVFRSDVLCEPLGGILYGTEVITDLEYIFKGQDPDLPSEVEHEYSESREKDFQCSVVEVKAPGDGFYIRDNIILNGTPIHLATRNKDAESLALLIGLGADVDAVDPEEATPLHVAVETNSLECVKLLLSAGGRVDARDKQGMTPLNHAAVIRDMEMVELLLSAGADVNTRSDEYGVTPLANCLNTIDVPENRDQTIRLAELVRVLLDAGADPNIRENADYEDEGPTAIFLAVEAHDIEVMKMLIEAGARLDIEYAASRDYPLHLVMCVAEAECLIELGADVNAALPVRGTALHRQARAGHPRVVALLIEKGANPNAPIPESGCTPLHMLFRTRTFERHQHRETLKVLLEAGADLGAVDAEGRTPIDVAVENEALEAFHDAASAPEAISALLDGLGEMEGVVRSWKAEIFVSGNWTSDGIRWPDEESASLAAQDLSSRWAGSENFRATETLDEPNWGTFAELHPDHALLASSS
jgi:ankyrin repeat protein